MQGLGILKTKEFKISLRAGVITFYMLLCSVLAVVIMGGIYSTMEFTAFGNETEFLERIGHDEYLFFGKHIYFPIASWSERTIAFTKTYCTGIIKLLNLAVSKIKELANLINVF